MLAGRRDVVALALAGLAPALPAAAQGWKPQRTIRMIVPYAPGGGADTTARLLVGPMSVALARRSWSRTAAVPVVRSARAKWRARHRMATR
jgi:hypothetical protein